MQANIQQLSVSEVLNKRTLIIGELGSGKTLLTLKLTLNLVGDGYGKYITILDFAPKKIGNIGGRFLDFGFNPSKVFAYLAPPKVYTPRISAKSPQELLSLAVKNRENIEKIISKYLVNPTEILVINDLTLYLHAGSLELIDECIMLSKTFIANAYYGHELSFNYGTGITAKERSLIMELVKYMDNIIVLKRKRRNR
ncbi:MAG: hypothetical protein DRN04_15645 [Thermoprotei archaeon]|nr:MAG: hypothetical protein DRN04_15645 [Thermoprotei archaeon]